MKQVGFKEIMSQIDKKKASEFILIMRRDWLPTNTPPSQFKNHVLAALSQIGIVGVDFNNNTANAICNKMAHKAGFDIF